MTVIALHAQESRFHDAIQAFVEGDKLNSPPSNAILFVGSSSIRYWSTLHEDMAPLTVINRGFGGSQMYEVNMFRDQIVLPYRPKAIVVYEGDNDVFRGKSVDEITEEVDEFIAYVAKQLPDSEVFFIAVKPSIARAELWGTMEKVNNGLKSRAAQNEKVHFLDVATPMLSTESFVDPSLFIADGLHLNAKGYALWTRVIYPVLMDKFANQD